MNRRRSRSGSNAVEFAVALLMLVPLTSGVIDLSYFFHLQFAMVNAVAQGARAGATTEVADAPLTQAQQTAADAWVTADLPPNATFTAVYGVVTAPDRTIEVTGNATNTPLMGLVPSPTSIAHTTVMRMEDQTVP